MVKIDEGIRKLVVGARQRDVKKELGICRSSVQKIWKKFLNTGAVSDISRSSRPMKSSERDRRLLVIQAKKALFLSAQVWRRFKFNSESLYHNYKKILTKVRVGWASQRKDITFIKVSSKTKIAVVLSVFVIHCCKLGTIHFLRRIPSDNT